MVGPVVAPRVGGNGREHDAAGLQHARELAHGGLVVVEVLEHLAADDRVERAGLEAQRVQVGELDRAAVAHQLPHALDERLAGVDRGDVVARVEQAQGERAGAAAGVEHVAGGQRRAQPPHHQRLAIVVPRPVEVGRVAPAVRGQLGGAHPADATSALSRTPARSASGAPRRARSLLMSERPSMPASLASLVELLLGLVRVDAAVGALGVVARGAAGLLGLRVRRARLVLELPVVALLLGDVLDGGERGAVRALLRVVLLVGRVERLLVGVLHLLGRALDRAGEVFLFRWHTVGLPAPQPRNRLLQRRRGLGRQPARELARGLLRASACACPAHRCRPSASPRSRAAARSGAVRWWMSG